MGKATHAKASEPGSKASATPPLAPALGDAKTHLERQVRTWLTDEGYALVPVSLGGPQPPHWVFGVVFSPGATEENQGKLVTVVVGREDIGRIDLILEFNLEPEAVAKLRFHGERPSPHYLKVRGVFLAHEIGFNFRGSDPKAPDAVRLDDLLYLDAPLSRHLLMGSLRRLYRIALHFSQVLVDE